MRVGITGATGFLGSHHAEAWLDAGHDVAGIVRTPSKGAWLTQRGAVMRKADLLDQESLVQAFSGLDVLVANAAVAPGHRQVDVDNLRHTNIQGTRNTLEAAATAGVTRVIYISSVSVYRTRLLRAVREDGDRIDPEEPGFDWNQLTTNRAYSRSKAAAEQLAWRLAHELGLDLTVLRPGPIYGPRDGDLTARYLGQIDRTIFFAPIVRAPHVHARDVAEAALAATHHAVSIGRAYNVTGACVSPFDVLRTLRRLRGGGALLVPVGLPLWVDFDDTAAQRDLGLRFRSLEEGLRSVLDHTTP